MFTSQSAYVPVGYVASQGVHIHFPGSCSTSSRVGTMVVGKEGRNRMSEGEGLDCLSELGQES